MADAEFHISFNQYFDIDCRERILRVNAAEQMALTRMSLVENDEFLISVRANAHKCGNKTLRFLYTSSRKNAIMTNVIITH